MNQYEKMAILLVRFMAAVVIILGLLGLVYGAALSTSGTATAQQSERWVNGLWYIGLGLALFAGSRPLGRLLGRGLE